MEALSKCPSLFELDLRDNIRLSGYEDDPTAEEVATASASGTKPRRSRLPEKRVPHLLVDAVSLHPSLRKVCGIPLEGIFESTAVRLDLAYKNLAPFEVCFLAVALRKNV